MAEHRSTSKNNQYTTVLFPHSKQVRTLHKRHFIFTEIRELKDKFISEFHLEVGSGDSESLHQVMEELPSKTTIY